MKRFFCIEFCLFFVLTISAQTVGLVLSGGGAKGLTHIGVIKALEENDIPIDYISGTSMGAIVGSMYAMGMTTDEIIDLVRSKEFRYWQTGKIEPQNRYYFRQADPKPDIITLNFRVKEGDSLKLKSQILPTNLMSPRQMNYAFVPLYAPATAACKGNFDELMIPFRCVASDIHKKEAIIFDSGDLGDAVRASMSFPFMFRPVQINGDLLFDGGIYNNFPVNVIQNDLKADYVIGSNVSENPAKPDPTNILDQLEQMILKRTEDTIKKGTLLEFKLSGISLWDFSVVDQLVQLGYDSTIAHIDEIKQAVSKRVTKEEMQMRRQQFKSKLPDIKFKNIIFSNLTTAQQEYIERNFHKKDEIFSLSEFRDGYFKLISDNVFLEIIPHAIYNPTSNLFDLELEVITENQFKILIGGNISTSTPNQTYVGLSYQNLTDIAQSAWLDVHFGKTYNGVNIGTRIDVPYHLYLKPQICLHRFDYYEGDKIFFESDKTAFFNQNELYAKFSFGFPFTMKGRIEAGVGYGFLTDRYIQDLQLAIEYQEYDRSTYSLLNVYGRSESNTLNSKNYPTAGRYWMWSTQMLYGTKNYYSILFPIETQTGDKDFWFQFKGMYEDYIKCSRYFTLGLQANFALSTRKLLHNYTATLIQAPKFAPTPHSRIIFNEGFCANQYMAYGIKPICTINDQFHIRTEAYVFLPYKNILRKSDNTAYYSDKIFGTARFMAEASLVYNFKIASASVYANYYSTPKNQWNIGLNIGFLLFKERFIE